MTLCVCAPLTYDRKREGSLGLEKEFSIPAEPQSDVAVPTHSSAI